jgi:MinD-like ATPase involved in chromosome partitioning or flagellar assembly
MVIACWSPKGGSGTTVVAVSLARMLAETRSGGALFVDLGGDAPAALGAPEPSGPGVAEWLHAGDAVPADGLARIEHDMGRGLRMLCRGDGELANAARAEVLAAVLAADRRMVVIDCGRVAAPGSTDPTDQSEVGRVLAATATHSLLVVRPCYLALRRAVAMSFRPSGVVVVNEQARALAPDDIEEILGVPVVAVVQHDPSIGRAVDAGLLGSRIPAALAKALRRAA